MFWFIIGLLFGALCQVVQAEVSEEKIIYDAMIDVRVLDRYSIQELNPDSMMDFAFEVGKSDNLGESLRAIVFLESGFGRAGRIGDHGISRGVTQIQIPTAKFILNKLMNVKYNFSDKEIIKLLTYNDKMSIILSKYYLIYLMDKFKNHTAGWSKGLLSYNVGPSAVREMGLQKDPNDYLNKAKRFIIRKRKS
jgi:hypothetical protein